jgi:hypothetical protein
MHLGTSEPARWRIVICSYLSWELCQTKFTPQYVVLEKTNTVAYVLWHSDFSTKVGEKYGPIDSGVPDYFDNFLLDIK